MPEKFERIELISRSFLCENWLGKRQLQNRSVVIKRPVSSAEFNTDDINRMLKESSDTLRHFHHKSILRPIATYEHDGLFHVVTRFLRKDERKTLSAELLLANPIGIIKQLFAAVDFVHLMGYVHCDLKPENIFVFGSGSCLRVLLNDFDLVRSAGSRPGGKLFGTRPYIAPEIFDDDVIVAQSDNYSIGIMLLLLLHRDRTAMERKLADQPPGAEVGQLFTDDELLGEISTAGDMIRALLRVQHQLRPSSLVSLLGKYLDVSAEESLTIERELLGRVLISKFRTLRWKRNFRPMIASHFLKNTAHLYGIPEEMLHEIDEVPGSHPLRQYRLIRSLINHARLTRFGSNWTVSLDRQGLVAVLGDPLVSAKPLAASEPQSRKEHLRTAFRLKGNRHYMKAALHLIQLLNPAHRFYSNELAPQIKLRIAEYYRDAGFSADAQELFKELRNDPSLSLHKKLMVFKGIADVGRLDRNLDEYWLILREGYAVSRKVGSFDNRVRFIERSIAMYYSRAWMDRYYRRAKRLNDIVRHHPSVRARLLAQNLYGIAELLKGNLYAAKSVLTSAYNLGLQHQDKMLGPICVNLGSILNDLGQFRKALTTVAQARALNTRRSRSPMQDMLAELLLADSYLILGEYQESDEALGRHLAIAHEKGDPGSIALNALATAYGNLWRGRLDDAGANLATALPYYQATTNLREFSRCYSYLALNECFSGRTSSARQFLRLGEELNAGTGDAPRGLELRQVRLLTDSEESGSLDTVAMFNLAGDYFRLGHLVRGFRCVIVLLCNGAVAEVEGLLKEWPTAMEFAEGSGAVHARAAMMHLQALKSARAEGDAGQLSDLRSAMMFYRQHGLNYFAYQVCMQIAEIYRAQGRFRLERGYISEATRLANLLSNKSKLDRCRNRMAEISREASITAQSNRIVLEISRLLKSMQSYRKVVEALLLFAIEESGAERGAILLATQGGKSLRIEHAVDCDVASLKDILVLSQSVVRSVFEQRMPLIINDAIHDEKTRNFQSIIMHNIYSVACVPLMIDEVVVGVLYLDHHTLSIVFTDDERAIIEALSNFIAITLQRARAADLAERQSKHMRQAGAAHGYGRFETANRELQSMLNGIPAVADSPLPVLISGPTGTGKEVLALEVHALSSYSDGPFVALNCASLRGELGDAELFGIEDKVATGVAKRLGKIVEADGGTLFLDEMEICLLTHRRAFFGSSMTGGCSHVVRTDHWK